MFNKNLTLDQQLLMEDGAAITCKDKINKVNKSVSIIPTHINMSLDQPVEFPEFSIIKKSGVDGSLSLNLRKVLILDVDDEPTEDSIKLLTSGQLYLIINNLQDQINELRDSIKK